MLSPKCEMYLSLLLQDRSFDTPDLEPVLWRVKQALTLAGLKPDDLLAHYLQVAQPAMPVLQSNKASKLNDMAPALAAVVLAKAVELQDHLYPLRRYIWEIVKAARIGEIALRQANLTGIAVGVIELSGRPSLDTRSDHILLASVRRDVNPHGARV